MQSKRTSRIEKLLARLFISLVVLGLTLGLCDLASRPVISSRSSFEQRFPVQVFRHPTPYTMFTGQKSGVLPRGSRISYEESVLNEMGFRGPVPVCPKPSGEFRIIVLGGSTTVNGNPPIPALLQERLRQRGLSGACVYNFGVVSSVSGMELARIVFEVTDTDCDLVVMYNGANDILHPLAWDPRPGHPFNFIVYEHNPLLESGVSSYPAFALLAYGSNLMRVLFPTYFTRRLIDLEGLRKEAGWQTDPWRDAIAQAYVTNVEKAARVSRAFGAEFAVFIQPAVFDRANVHPAERAFIDEDKASHYGTVKAKIMDLIGSSDAGIASSTFDVPELFGAYSDPVFIDSLHTTQEAKEIIADSMAKRLANLLQARK